MSAGEFANMRVWIDGDLHPFPVESLSPRNMFLFGLQTSICDLLTVPFALYRYNIVPNPTRSYRGGDWASAKAALGAKTYCLSKPRP